MGALTAVADNSPFNAPTTASAISTATPSCSRKDSIIKMIKPKAIQKQQTMSLVQVASSEAKSGELQTKTQEMLLKLKTCDSTKANQ